MVRVRRPRLTFICWLTSQAGALRSTRRFRRRATSCASSLSFLPVVPLRSGLPRIAFVLFFPGHKRRGTSLRAGKGFHSLAGKFDQPAVRAPFPVFSSPATVAPLVVVSAALAAPDDGVEAAAYKIAIATAGGKPPNRFFDAVENDVVLLLGR